MAVKIRLKRMGKIRTPFYRIVVADARTKRDGRVIEEIGTYNPKTDPSIIKVNSERAQHWLSVGAQPSEPVRALLRKTGDWQKFRGEPAPPPLLEVAPRADKADSFNAALKDAHGESDREGATTKRTAKKRTAKAAAPKAEEDAEPKADGDVEPKAAEDDKPAAKPGAAEDAEPKADGDAEPKAAEDDKPDAEPKAAQDAEPKADEDDKPKADEG